MRNKKFFSLLLSGVMIMVMGTTSYVSGAEAEIADIQAERDAAEAGLAHAQSSISNLESQKQGLENYLVELSTQYDELTNSISQLSIEAGKKEEELKLLQNNLGKAKEASKKQYEAMKIRIAYMYEKGGTSTLEMLLSSETFVDFLNRAQNVSEIVGYDRNMLKKYENLQSSIAEQEDKVESESNSINQLMAERSAKQQEVQELVSSTNENIASYMQQIRATQEEANALMAQISNADNSIALLMQQVEAEKQAQEAAQAAQAEQNTDQEEDYGYNPEEDTTESSSSSTSSDVIVEEVEEEDESAPSSGNTETGSSGQGTYLGNFTLTAYCNCAQCCGTAGNLTASGTVPASGHTVAMAGVPFGTQLLINGTVYTVEDLGTPYGHVDIYFDTHEEALSFGLQSADVYQL